MIQNLLHKTAILFNTNNGLGKSLANLLMNKGCHIVCPFYESNKPDLNINWAPQKISFVKIENVSQNSFDKVLNFTLSQRQNIDYLIFNPLEFIPNIEYFNKNIEAFYYYYNAFSIYLKRQNFGHIIALTNLNPVHNLDFAFSQFIYKFIETEKQELNSYSVSTTVALRNQFEENYIKRTHDKRLILSEKQICDALEENAFHKKLTQIHIQQKNTIINKFKNLLNN